MFFEMRLQLLDIRGEQSDLYFRRPGVALSLLIILNNLCLNGCVQRHGYFSNLLVENEPIRAGLQMGSWSGERRKSTGKEAALGPVFRLL